MFYQTIICTGSSTLPRATTRGTETELGRESKVPAATSSTSLYDNVASGNASGQTTAQGIYFCVYFSNSEQKQLRR